MTRPLLPLALGALLLTGAAAPEAVPPPVPLKLVETLSRQGIQEISPGAIVSTAIISKPDVAVLGGDLALDHKGQQRRFARGEVLQTGTDAGFANPPPVYYCEKTRVGSVGKALSGQLAFGLVGALRPTQLNTRFCLFDSDRDRAFDHAFLIGAKGAGQAPFEIPATDYGVIEGRRLSDDSIARLRYAGPAGTDDRIAFDLEAVAFGRMREVPHPRYYVSVAKLPNYLIVGTAVVTVLRYDVKSHVATIRMDHDLAPGHIVLPELSRAY